MKTKSRRKRGPFETVKVGSFAAPIYRNAQADGSWSYVLAWWEHGTRKRKRFSTLEAAVEAGQEEGRKQSAGEINTISLAGEDRLTYGRSLEALKGTGASLDRAAHEWAEGYRVTGGRVLEACRAFADQTKDAVAKKMVPEAVSEFIASKRKKGKLRLVVTDRYLRLLTCPLNRFADAFRTYVASVKPEAVNEWIANLRTTPRSKKTRSQPLAPGTRSNYRNVIVEFMEWCRKMGYIPRSYHLDEIEPWTRRKMYRVGALDPADMKRLLAAAEPDVIPLLAIVGFSGVRHFELGRVRWENIHLSAKRDERYIFIPAPLTKTKDDSAEGRIVPIMDNLFQWLLTFRRTSGSVLPHEDMSKALRKTAKKAGLPWRRNYHRHSYISYRVATTKNAAATALESGNSEATIKRFYLEVLTRTGQKVTEALAKEWFTITPDTVSKAPVIQMPLPGEATADQASQPAHKQEAATR